jgi:transposase
MPIICVASSDHAGTTAVIRTRKHQHPFDATNYRVRNVIERTFCRLKVFRWIATRYDKLAQDFLATRAQAQEECGPRDMMPRSVRLPQLARLRR